MTLSYVDLDTARAARGTRIITSALVPSPWSEAAKGLFELARLPASVFGRPRAADEVTKWTGIDNVPVVMHDDEPPRTCWSAIVGLAARLAAPETIIPSDPEKRAPAMGLVEMIAGEEGLGWNARLAMIDASLQSDGARGFPLPIAQRLAKRYGHSGTTHVAAVRDRIGVQLGVLRDRLGGAEYFGGTKPSAVDVYSATFLTPLFPIDDSVCPQMLPALRVAFAAARDAFGDLVAKPLAAHRARMFERHLTWPIRL